MEAVVLPEKLKSQVNERLSTEEAQNVEGDLFTINAIAPKLLEDIPALFGETVRGSVRYMLGTEESKRALAGFRDSEISSRTFVFASLASVYGARASPIQKMIDRVFGIRVHELLQRLI